MDGVVDTVHGVMERWRDHWVPPSHSLEPERTYWTDFGRSIRGLTLTRLFSAAGGLYVEPVINYDISGNILQNILQTTVPFLGYREPVQ